MKTIALLILCLVIGCSTQGQPTPTSNPPPAHAVTFGWTPPSDAGQYSNVSYQLWVGTNSGVYTTNVSTVATNAVFSNWNWGTNYVNLTASATGSNGVTMTGPYAGELIYFVQPPIGAPTGLTHQ